MGTGLRVTQGQVQGRPVLLSGDWGRIHFQPHSGCGQNPLYRGRTEVSVSLLAVSHSVLSSWRSCAHLCHGLLNRCFHSITAYSFKAGGGIPRAEFPSSFASLWLLFCCQQEKPLCSLTWAHGMIGLGPPQSPSGHIT